MHGRRNRTPTDTCFLSLWRILPNYSLISHKKLFNPIWRIKSKYQKYLFWRGDWKKNGNKPVNLIISSRLFQNKFLKDKDLILILILALSLGGGLRSIAGSLRN